LLPDPRLHAREIEVEEVAALLRLVALAGDLERAAALGVL
jgi:hypothetical protein